MEVEEGRAAVEGDHFLSHTPVRRWKVRCWASPKIFQMKADLLLPEHSAARGNPITMRVWQSESARLLSRLHEEYGGPQDTKDPIRLLRTRTEIKSFAE